MAGRGSPLGRVLKRAPLPKLAERECAEFGSVLEIETRTHRFRWRRGSAKLLWFPELRAFVWLQGVAPGSRRPAGDVGHRAADAFERFMGRRVRYEKTIRVPKLRGSWRSLGVATRIDYYSDKWSERAEYTHPTGATLYRFGGRTPPWIWVLRGGTLRVTTRGIEG